MAKRQKKKTLSETAIHIGETIAKTGIIPLVRINIANNKTDNNLFISLTN